MPLGSCGEGSVCSQDRSWAFKRMPSALVCSRFLSISARRAVMLRMWRFEI